MKPIKLLAFATLSLAATASAGNLGPAPWNNGAYFQGQFDGTYTAAVYSSPGLTNDPVTGAPVFTGAVISGVVGFALTDGMPRTITGLTPPTIDDSKNFYAIFANGVSFSGQTLANINIDRKTVAGTFTPSDYTSSGGASESFMGGSFMAKIKSDKAIFTFSGDGMLNTTLVPLSGASSSSSGVVFRIDGIKASNN